MNKSYLYHRKYEYVDIIRIVDDESIADSNIDKVTQIFTLSVIIMYIV